MAQPAVHCSSIITAPTVVVLAWEAAMQSKPTNQLRRGPHHIACLKPASCSMEFWTKDGGQRFVISLESKLATIELCLECGMQTRQVAQCHPYSAVITLPLIRRPTHQGCSKDDGGLWVTVCQNGGLSQQDLGFTEGMITVLGPSPFLVDSKERVEQMEQCRHVRNELGVVTYHSQKGSKLSDIVWWWSVCDCLHLAVSCVNTSGVNAMS